MKINAFSGIKPSKTWVVLGAALGIGLLAALAAYAYLSNQMAAIEARGKQETVPVVVAKFNLVKGAALTSDNVAVRAVPKDFAHSGAISPQQFDRVEGQALAYAVNGGEMILWGLMEQKRAPTFSGRIAAGRRAITLPVDEINSISGLLEPGDNVDLVVSVEKKDKKLTFPLLQNVPVMATGQRVVDDPRTGERRSYSTVTLDATPEEAQQLIVARDVGKITALLRHPEDRQPLAGATGNLSALLGAAEAERSERPIPVLYGGRAGALSAEGLNLRHREISERASAQAAPRGEWPGNEVSRSAQRVLEAP